MRDITARCLLACAAVSLVPLAPLTARATLRDQFALQGYVRETPIAWKEASYVGGQSGRMYTNLLHTRQNLRWYPSPSLTAGIDLKTRVFTGDAAGAILRQSDAFGVNETFFDWDHTFLDHERSVLVAAIDRAWITAYAGPVQATVGRQRIAWGTNLVWNPIDLFNPSSPLDFDNEEKPGNDAARVQAYFGPNSKIEAGVSPQRTADRTTAAFEAVVNRWEYDWAVVAGRRRSEAVFGGAWAGDIRGGGFRGELLYARPRREPGAIDPYVTASVEGDYTFSNSLYLHVSTLYNEGGTTGDAGGLKQIDAFVRGWLTPARLSLFAEVAGDLSPLVRADLSAILNPNDGSWYIGPMVTWSVITNVDLAVMGLVFGGDPGTEFGDAGEIGLLRLKVSF